jgi:hypothetical protein
MVVRPRIAIHYLRARTLTKGYSVRRIAISGLVAVAAVLGAVAVPVTATAQATTTVRPTAAVRPGITARPADVALVNSGLPTVSCVLATDCLGIEGSATQSGQQQPTPTRVARWNGSSWKRLSVALPKGTTAVDLDGVSCRAAKSCLVVGDYYTSPAFSGTSRVLALAYNGTSLKPTPAVPLPKGTTDGALSGVSCVTTRYCVALGVADGNTAAFGPFGSVTIIETWNGAKWTLHTIAAPTGHTTMAVPSVVSCATSAFCVLAGDAYSLTANSSTVKPYVVSWNGKKLTAMKTATVGASKDGVVATGVSCATASNCAVTGVDVGPITNTNATDSTAFTQIWNGKTWQLAKVTWPKAVKSSVTTGVSCYAAHSCEAVGEVAANAEMSPSDAAAVSFGSTAGKVQAVPAPPKGNSNAFSSLSCLPGGSCVAIGGTGKTTAKSPALMTGVWNGKAWKLDPGF